MSKHTPKDWTFDQASGEVRAHGGVVACVNTIEERGQADGALIAAAPELLEALQDLVQADAVGMGKSAFHIRWQRAISAIAKAEGGP